jgi:hypothetical protein
VTLWVVLGFAVARFTGSRDIPPWASLVALVGMFLVYGLVLSRIVELAV